MIGGRSALLAAGAGLGYGNWTGNYSDVSLLLRGYGGELAIADESPRVKGLSTTGIVEVSASQKKYGNDSIFISGNQYSALTTPGGVDFNFGTGDFTVEMWIYPISITTYGILFATAGSNTVGSLYMHLHVSSPGTTLNLETFTDSSRPKASATGVQLNQWNHVAGVRSGNIWTVFVNGIAGSSTTISQSLTSTTTRIGSNADEPASGRFTGFIDDLRITKGVARYTSNFTPPASELPANATDDPSYNNVSLLLRGGVPNPLLPLDESPTPKSISITGNTSLSTTQSKYGGSSIYFDGNGDWLTTPSNVDFAYGTGDFTIEGWIWPLAVLGSDRMIWDQRLSPGDSGIGLFIDANGQLNSYQGNALRGNSAPYSLQPNTWNHFAYVRSGSVFSVYINGVSGTPTTLTNNIGCPGDVRIGIRQDGAVPYFGYIDDLRITKGVARYTKNFLPPPAELPAI